MIGLSKYFRNPRLIWVILANRGLFDWMSDEKYLALKYWIVFHKKLDISNPMTFNEKIQWLKLYDRRPEYTIMVDKYTAKEYARRIIGERYIIPNLGVWEHFDDIDFDSLPQKFVLKCTHDSGGVVVVRDKEKFDRRLAKKKIEKSLKKNFYYIGREWQYKNVKPRIIAEKWIGSTNDSISDYKFLVFDGKVKAFYITYDRGKDSGTRIDVFDRNCNRILMKWGYENSDYEFTRPPNFEEMIRLAEVMGKGFIHIRVDFYNINGNIYIGELTFHTWSGFERIIPEKWDYEFGKWIKLPLEEDIRHEFANVEK